MANHPIVHVEIPAAQTKEAAEFYAKVFDWKLSHDSNFDYWMFDGEGGPGGGFVQPGASGSEINRLIVYIGTEDMEASLAAIEANGGKIIQPSMEIPETGWFAMFSDPAGNTLGLYKSITTQQES